MTLEECEDFKKNSSMMQSGQSDLLIDVLKQAQTEHRVVNGMYAAAKCLSSNAQDVALCILPQNHLNDVAQHINHMLVEAFCNEHEICVLKVDCEEKLAKLLLCNNNTFEKNGRYNDFSCILVKANQNAKNYEIDKLICAQDIGSAHSSSIIELPIQ